MKLSPLLNLCLSAVLLGACGQSGEQTAHTVQAATKAAAEAGQQLAEKAAEIAQMAPEQAKLEFQQLVDASAKAFEEVKDSQAVQNVADEVKRALEQLSTLKATLGPKLNLASLQAKVTELIEKFKNEPHVVSALKAVQELVNKLSR